MFYPNPNNYRRSTPNPRHARALLSLACVALLAACASPGQRFIDDATRRGFSTTTHHAATHPLVVLRTRMPGAGEPLHVYLDGDGMPMLSRHRIASDPSSRSRLILDLIERDPAASVLVGRPCYYQQDHTCNAQLWTDRRYSEEVVDSLAEVIAAEIDRAPESPLTLIGYSGGGALAMLLAPRMPRLERVVTIAANLDVAAWATHHGYSPLTGSLDPATAAPLPADIRQLHLFGERDENVPPALMQAAAGRGENSEVRIVAGYDHVCCWSELWPAPLAERPGQP